MTDDESWVPEWVDRELYPFTPRRLEVLGEGTLNYLDESPADPQHGPVVFVHGTPTWSFEWRHLVAGLKDSYRCLAPDHLGFGLSERPFGAAYSPEAHARRFRGWIEELDLQDITLVVHDFGGPIALPIALEQPGRVSRLIVMNSWMWSFVGDPHVERGARVMGGAFGRWLYRAFNASLRIITPYAYADRKKLTRRIHAQYLAPFAGIDSRERVLWTLAQALLGSSDFYADLWDRRADLRDLSALIVWGTRDRALPHRYLDRWREALPRAEAVELPVGHWPQEEAPEQVLAAVRGFLQESLR